MSNFFCILIRLEVSRTLLMILPRAEVAAASAADAVDVADAVDGVDAADEAAGNSLGKVASAAAVFRAAAARPRGIRRRTRRNGTPRLNRTLCNLQH